MSKLAMFSSRPGKLLAALWILALSALVIWGRLGFGFLPCAGLVCLSIPVSFVVGRGAERIAKSAWLALWIPPALVFLLFRSGETLEFVGVFAVYSGAVLTFPAGVAVAALFGFLVSTLDPTVSGFSQSLLFNVSFAVLVFVAGYLQWFRLVPFLIKKLQERRARVKGE